MQATNETHPEIEQEQFASQSFCRHDRDKTLEAMIRRVVREEVAVLRNPPQPPKPSEIAEVIEQSSFTQDDMLTAIFSLLAGLAEHVTGKKVSVSLRNKYDRCMPVGADPESVRFL